MRNTDFFCNCKMRQIFIRNKNDFVFKLLSNLIMRPRIFLLLKSFFGGKCFFDKVKTFFCNSCKSKKENRMKKCSIPRLKTLETFIKEFCKNQTYFHLQQLFLMLSNYILKGGNLFFYQTVYGSIRLKLTNFHEVYQFF